MLSNKEEKTREFGENDFVLKTSESDIVLDAGIFFDKTHFDQ